MLIVLLWPCNQPSRKRRIIYHTQPYKAVWASARMMQGWRPGCQCLHEGCRRAEIHNPHKRRQLARSPKYFGLLVLSTTWILVQPSLAGAASTLRFACDIINQFFDRRLPLHLCFVSPPYCALGLGRLQPQRFYKVSLDTSLCVVARLHADLSVRCVTLDSIPSMGK